jgi:hypothetical protein
MGMPRLPWRALDLTTTYADVTGDVALADDCDAVLAYALSSGVYTVTLPTSPVHEVLLIAHVSTGTGIIQIGSASYPLHAGQVACCVYASGSWAVSILHGAALVSVSTLPTSPVDGAVYLLVTADTTAKASAGPYVYDGTQWARLEGPDTGYTLGSLSGETTLAAVDGVQYTASGAASGSTLVLTLPDGGACRFRLTNCAELGLPAGWVWHTAEPTLQSSGVDLLIVERRGSTYDAWAVGAV